MPRVNYFYNSVLKHTCPLSTGMIPQGPRRQITQTSFVPGPTTNPYSFTVARLGQVIQVHLGDTVTACLNWKMCPSPIQNRFQLCFCIYLQLSLSIKSDYSSRYQHYITCENETVHFSAYRSFLYWLHPSLRSPNTICICNILWQTN